MKMENLRKQWNDACLQVGIESISPQKAAKIAAVVMHLGNNEAMVMNKHFTADCEYIQNRYGVKGGEVPDAAFVGYFKEYEKDLREALEKDFIPQWAVTLFKQDYEITLYK